MIEGGAHVLIWLLPVLAITIWLQRGASFLLPHRLLERPLLLALNRWAPMAVMAVLVLIGLDTGLVSGWLGIAIELALLAALGVFYWFTRLVLVTIILGAACHWAISLLLATAAQI